MTQVVRGVGRAVVGSVAGLGVEPAGDGGKLRDTGKPVSFRAPSSALAD